MIYPEQELESESLNKQPSQNQKSVLRGLCALLVKTFWKLLKENCIKYNKMGENKNNEPSSNYSIFIV